MSKQQREKQAADQETQACPERSAAIGKYVLHTLGQPKDLQRVQVHALWPDHYRVNVLVGADAASARVAHSYFLVADGAGQVLTTMPVLTRQYKAAEATL